MRFSTTWVVLAAMTEAPVVMVFCRMEPDGRYHIEFRPAFHVPKDAPEKGKNAAMGPALHRDSGRTGSPAIRPTATTISSGASRMDRSHSTDAVALADLLSRERMRIHRPLTTGDGGSRDIARASQALALAGAGSDGDPGGLARRRFRGRHRRRVSHGGSPHVQPRASRRPIGWRSRETRSTAS